jgi:hypothetical protein
MSISSPVYLSNQTGRPNGPHVYEVPGADITKFEQQPNVLQRRIWLYRRGQADQTCGPIDEVDPV